MRLGTLIRKERHRKNVSMTQLADYCGISLSHLSRIESGKREAGPTLMKSIAEGLGIGSDPLFLAAGRVPDDVNTWLLQTPGALGRLRKVMCVGWPS